MTTIEGTTSVDGRHDGPTGAERFDITLFWRGEPRKGDVPHRERYVFICIGSRFGPYHWEPLLIEIDRQLPEMSHQERSQLIAALRETLEEEVGAKIAVLESDLFLERDV